jgi:hypothetical protein
MKMRSKMKMKAISYKIDKYNNNDLPVICDNCGDHFSIALKTGNGLCPVCKKVEWKFDNLTLYIHMLSKLDYIESELHKIKEKIEKIEKKQE